MPNLVALCKDSILFYENIFKKGHKKLIYDQKIGTAQSWDFWRGGPKRGFGPEIKVQNNLKLNYPYASLTLSVIHGLKKIMIIYFYFLTQNNQLSNSH